MSMIITTAGIVLIILVVFVLYAVYQWHTQERNGDDVLTPDEKIGLEKTYEHEKEALELAEKWRDKTHEVYHFQLVSSEVLDTYIGDPTEEALKENLKRAEEAIQTHKDRIKQLLTYAKQNNIDLKSAKVTEENEENEENEGNEEDEENEGNEEHDKGTGGNGKES